MSNSHHDNPSYQLETLHFPKCTVTVVFQRTSSCHTIYSSPNLLNWQSHTSLIKYQDSLQDNEAVINSNSSLFQREFTLPPSPLETCRVRQTANWYFFRFVFLKRNVKFLKVFRASLSAWQANWEQSNEKCVTSVTVLVRFVVMTALNLWVLLTVLYYQKQGSRSKKDD